MEPIVKNPTVAVGFTCDITTGVMSRYIVAVPGETDPRE
jgi:hypothetical protein